MSPDILRLGVGQSRTRPSIKVVGVGGAGCNIVSDSTFEAVAICKQEEAHNVAKFQRRCLLSGEHLRLLKTTSPQMISSIGGNLRSGIFSAIGDADVMFLFTGLGGDTGSHVTPALAHICRKHARMVIVSATLPFSVEGGDRRYIASSSMDKVMEHSDMLISYANDSLLKIAPNLPLRKAFSAMDIIMMAPVVELACSLTMEDLQQVRSDFAAAKHVRTGIGISGGCDRELRAVDEAFTSPWFDFDLRQVKAALVIVTAIYVDENMVSKVAKDVALRLPNAKVRFTGRAADELGDRVKVVVLAGIGPVKP